MVIVIEANPGIFRPGFIYGRVLKPIELDTISDFDVEPVYERKGYALKLGVGKSQNYVDFILFKAKDDPGSLQTPDSNSNELIHWDLLPNWTEVLLFSDYQIFIK